MKLVQFKLLTDENIHRVVVELLRQRGFNVLDVAEEGLFGGPMSTCFGERLQKTVPL